MASSTIRQTGFPLTGSHTVPPRMCTDCHVNNNYNLNEHACIFVPPERFQQRDESDAVSLGFPTTCELCHDTIAWTDGKFDHNKTQFPLTGSHTSASLPDCHVNNNYTDAADGLLSAATRRITTPRRIRFIRGPPQFFPTNLPEPVTTRRVADATFNHTQYTQFPINHGNANGVCATCHTNSNDYSVFQCTNCHPKSQTDQNHRGVEGICVQQRELLPVPQQWAGWRITNHKGTF